MQKFMLCAHYEVYSRNDTYIYGFWITNQLDGASKTNYRSNCTRSGTFPSSKDSIVQSHTSYPLDISGFNVQAYCEMPVSNLTNVRSHRKPCLGYLTNLKTGYAHTAYEQKDAEMSSEYQKIRY